MISSNKKEFVFSYDGSTLSDFIDSVYVDEGLKSIEIITSVHVTKTLVRRLLKIVGINFTSVTSSILDFKKKERVMTNGRYVRNIITKKKEKKFIVRANNLESFFSSGIEILNNKFNDEL